MPSVLAVAVAMSRTSVEALDMADSLTTQLAATWGVYMDFYVTFLTLNFVALGAVWEKVGEGPGRTVLCVAFVLQNMVSFTTAAGMAGYSAELATAYPVGTEALSHAAGAMGHLGGWANAVSHAVLVFMWVVMIGHVNRRTQLREISSSHAAGEASR